MNKFVIFFLHIFVLTAPLFSQEEQNDSEYEDQAEDSTYFRQREKAGIRGSITAGLNLSDMIVHAEFPYTEEDLERGTGFNVGVGIEFLFFRRFSVELHVVWATYNASLSNYEIPDTALHIDDVVFNFSYMDLPVELKFYISGKRFSPYLFGGLRYGMLVEQDIAAQSTIEAHSKTYTLELDKWKRGYAGGIGFAFALTGGSELQLEAGYAYHSGREGTTEVFTNASFFFTVNYFF